MLIGIMTIKQLDRYACSRIIDLIFPLLSKIKFSPIFNFRRQKRFENSKPMKISLVQLVKTKLLDFE